jgi:hypothetical protein
MFNYRSKTLESIPKGDGFSVPVVRQSSTSNQHQWNIVKKFEIILLIMELLRSRIFKFLIVLYHIVQKDSDAKSDL